MCSRLDSNPKPSPINQKPSNLLQFCSNQPLQHKLGVIRTLVHRCATICKDRESRTQETQNLKEVLSVSGYTKKPWKVASGSCPRTCSSDPVSSGFDIKGSVVIPYVGQVSDQIARLFCSRGVMTHIHPYNTIRACLVRPKDRLSMEEQAGLVYSIKCVDCPASTSGRPRDPCWNGLRNTNVPSPQCVNTWPRKAIGSTGRMWRWGAMKQTGFGVVWLRQSASRRIAHHWTGIEAYPPRHLHPAVVVTWY